MSKRTSIPSNGTSAQWWARELTFQSWEKCLKNGQGDLIPGDGLSPEYEGWK
jgi:hypothetical protein